MRSPLGTARDRTPLTAAMRHRLFRACLCAAALAAAHALAGAQTLTVNAVVLSKNTCNFRSTPALSFNVDPGSGSAASGTASWVLRCNGSSAVASFALAAGDGQWSTGPGARRLRHTTTTTEFMAYTLSVPAGGNANKGVDTPFTITASIDPSAFQDALPGTYSDTVLITLSP